MELVASAFIAGLIGGATHCVGMCGPFVLGQVSARLERVPADRLSEWHRLRGAALLPYHLGRMTTYGLLGGLVGVMANGLDAVTGAVWLPTIFLALAAGFFVFYGLSGLIPALRRRGRGGRLGAWWARHLGRRLAPLFAAPVGWRGYVLGMVLGLLPCGMLYGALALAGAGGGFLAGAGVMAAFALGTAPALWGLGYLGDFAARYLRGALMPLGRGLMVVNGVLLAIMAGGRLP